MEPLTFSLTIVSALSLYSLLFTIFRSRWVWNAATTALFLGLASWLLSGLSGVVNATIAFDAFVHNTLWVVGHFHHMALLNIGLVIFAAVYAFLPRLVGRALYSDRLGMWHIWLTFFAGTAHSIIWMAQGLDGAPRRFSVLPSHYDSLNAAAIPFVLLLALAQLLFVWNMVQTFRGRVSHATFTDLLAGVPRPRVTSASLQGFAIVVTLLVMVGLGAAGWAVGRSTSDTEAAGFLPAPPKAPAAGGGGEGAAVFASAGCGGCHALAAAGSTGAVGPDLDALQPSEAAVADIVTNGRGAMPAFAGQLTPGQIDAVAVYVAVSAGSP
jgi:mono/diheme cytochrome c family protein